MHDSVLFWGNKIVKQYKLNNPSYSVLEVGSQNYNGSLREFFFDVAEYVGTDMQEGPGVDKVVSSHLLNRAFPERVDGETTYKQWDVIVCTEMLEHDPAFWITLSNIRSLLAKTGYLVLTARGATRGVEGRKNGESMWEHGYPNDYWRFMPEAVPLLLEMAGCTMLENKQDDQHPGFMALGRRE